jgi:hypothetical protein
MAWQAILLLGGVLLVAALLDRALRVSPSVTAEPTVVPGDVVLRYQATVRNGDRSPMGFPIYRYGTVSVTATHLRWDGSRGGRSAVPITGVGILAVGVRRTGRGRTRRRAFCVEVDVRGTGICVISAARRQIDLVVNHPYALDNQRRATLELVANLEARGAARGYRSGDPAGR